MHKKKPQKDSKISSTELNSKIKQTHDCVYCDEGGDLQKKLEQMIYIKYFESFNFYFAKPINEILASISSPHVILFKDYLYYDDIREYLKRSYNYEETLPRVKNLCEFYIKAGNNPKPNLCIHDQNKIIQKRNIKIHKLFLNKLHNYNDMPQTNRELNQQQQQQQQQPNKDMEFKVLVSNLNYDSSKPSNDKDDNTTDNVKSAIYEGSFKMMLDRYEKNMMKISYESKLYDIYNPSFSSERESFDNNTTSKKNTVNENCNSNSNSNNNNNPNQHPHSNNKINLLHHSTNNNLNEEGEEEQQQQPQHEQQSSPPLEDIDKSLSILKDFEFKIQDEKIFNESQQIDSSELNFLNEIVKSENIQQTNRLTPPPLLNKYQSQPTSIMKRVETPVIMPEQVKLNVVSSMKKSYDNESSNFREKIQRKQPYPMIQPEYIKNDIPKILAEKSQYSPRIHETNPNQHHLEHQQQQQQQYQQQYQQHHQQQQQQQQHQYPQQQQPHLSPKSKLSIEKSHLMTISDPPLRNIPIMKAPQENATETSPYPMQANMNNSQNIGINNKIGSSNSIKGPMNGNNNIRKTSGNNNNQKFYDNFNSLQHIKELMQKYHRFSDEFLNKKSRTLFEELRKTGAFNKFNPNEKSLEKQQKMKEIYIGNDIPKKTPKNNYLTRSKTEDGFFQQMGIGKIKNHPASPLRVIEETGLIIDGTKKLSSPLNHRKIKQYNRVLSNEGLPPNMTNTISGTNMIMTNSYESSKSIDQLMEKKIADLRIFETIQDKREPKPPLNSNSNRSNMSNNNTPQPQIIHQIAQKVLPNKSLPVSPNRKPGLKLNLYKINNAQRVNPSENNGNIISSITNINNNNNYNSNNNNNTNTGDSNSYGFWTSRSSRGIGSGGGGGGSAGDDYSSQRRLIEANKDYFLKNKYGLLENEAIEKKPQGKAASTSLTRSQNFEMKYKDTMPIPQTNKNNTNINFLQGKNLVLGNYYVIEKKPIESSNILLANYPNKNMIKHTKKLS